MSVPGN